MSEIKIQELFVAADRDGSGQLEQDEFRELLRNFNRGRQPTDQEFNFMMRIADTDHNGAIELDELQYALRAWKSYRHLDDYVLALFADFDLDEMGGVNVDALRALLQAINRGIPVPLHEVQYVMEGGNVVEGSAINRSELLGAIAAWYVNVERESSTVPALVKEAVVRTANESQNGDALVDRHRNWRDIASMFRGWGGYSQVGDAEALQGDQAHAAETGTVGDADAEVKALTCCTKCWRAMCKAIGMFLYFTYPFLAGCALIPAGWNYRDNACPRNLDGLMMWFGAMVMIMGGLSYRKGAAVLRAKVVVLMILVFLDVIGMLWAHGPAVKGAKEDCGYHLVYASMFWSNAATLFGVCYVSYFVTTHLSQLRIHDEHLQWESGIEPGQL